MLSVLAAAILGNAASLRLNLPTGTTLHFRLEIERDNPRETGTIDTNVKITSAQSGVIAMDATLTGLSINGKDRTADLRAMLSRATVSFSWTNLAQRTGAMTGIQMTKRNDELLPLLGEAGLYLCEFPRGQVQPGARWNGSVTATGGCTNGKYRLVSLEKGKAIVEVTDIAYLGATGVTPMRMVVDIKTGMPDLVEYTAMTSGNRKSHFVQRLVPVSN